MERINILIARLRSLVRRDAVIEDIEEEMRSHIEWETQTNIERGMKPEEARREALRSFGHLGRMRELAYEIRGGGMMETLWQDLRYGARMLLKSKGVTIIAVLSLAVGIGANTVIFSLVNAILLRSRPVARPDELVELYTSDQRDLYHPTSYPSYVDLRERAEVFTGLAAYDVAQFKLGGVEQVEQVWGETVSGNYFEVLGVRPIKGRAFLPEEDQTPGTHPVAVISSGLWQRRFNSDPEIVGQTIILNNLTLTIIGIAPPEYTGWTRGLASEVWVPVMMKPQLEPKYGLPMLTHRGNRWLTLTGRLKPGVTLEQARARFDLLAREMRDAHPEEWRQKREESGEVPELSMTILPESETRIRPEARAAVYALIALLVVIVNLVLLIACMNLANLLLARAVVRRREIAVRLAMGASRFRLIRQLLTESVLLALIAGAAGMVLTVWSLHLLIALMPPLPGGIRLAVDLGVDFNVLLYTLVFSTLTGLLFGLAPALQASKADVVAALKDESSGFAGGYRRSRLRNGLIVAQVALSLLLLIGAGLVLRSLEKVRPTRMGFESENVLIASLTLDEQQYDRSRSQAFYRQLSERIAALPGVQSVGLSSATPGLPGSERRGIGIEGYQAQPGERLHINSNLVGPRYFATMKIPVVEGRDFDERDRQGAPCVAIINEAFARRYFAPEGRALGKHLIQYRDQQPNQLCEIVGVVRDNRWQSLTKEPQPAFAFPLLQTHWTRPKLLVNPAGDPSNLTLAVRRAIQSLDPNISVTDVQTVREKFNLVLYPFRVFGLLIGACGVLALLLAAIGVYGVVSYSATQRTREIGIRLALGAQERDILKLVVGQGMILVLYGLSIGLLLAFALMRLLTSSLFRVDLLFGVSATDALTFSCITALLASVALMACYLPAQRATKVDPMVALRYE
jgi:predicted permease